MKTIRFTIMVGKFLVTGAVALVFLGLSLKGIAGLGTFLGAW